MDVYGFVYKITNTENGKVYVGQHMGKEFGDYWGSGLLLHKAYQKYGREKFAREIIEFAESKEELNRLECQYIKRLNSCAPKGYNIAPGGRGGYTGEPTEESRRKISRKLSGKPKSIEHRVKLSNARKGKPGHKHTEETKKKIGKSHLGIEPWNKGKGKEIIQMTLDGAYVRAWESLTEAEQNGFNKSRISECAHGKRKHHRNYLWRFSNGQQPDNI